MSEVVSIEGTPDKPLLRDGRGKFAPGNQSGGKAAGTQNRITKEVKAILEKAFEGIGGLEAFVEWGKANQTEFYKLWAKMLPLHVKADLKTVEVEELLNAGRQRVAALKENSTH